MENRFYQFSAKSLEDEEINFVKYSDTVVLVVNTASKCGFTPQYEGLEKLYEKYKDKGFEILGFPCNQFAHQEPGGKNEIETCLQSYKVKFQVFDKIEVNGKNAHPLFKYLKQTLPGTLGGRIKWNFTKFLIDKTGKPIKRYAPSTKPEDLTDVIEKLLYK
jgi:glutathione peroxidase